MELSLLAYIKKIFSILSRKERFRLYIQFAGMTFVAVLDMVGIASVMPFMAVVAQPDMIETNHWLNLTYELFEFTSLNSYLIFLGGVVFGLLILGNASKAVVAWLGFKYDNELNCELAHRLLGAYLARPYEFFLNRSSAEMSKNVLEEGRKVVAGILSPAMQIASNALLMILIMALLMIVNPIIAITIVVVLGGIYGVIYLTLRSRLTRMGVESVHASTMKHKAINECFFGIKDLKLLGKELSFLERFSFHARHHARTAAELGMISQLPRYMLETVAFGGILLIVLVSLGVAEAGSIVPLLALYAFAGYRLLPCLQQTFHATSNLRYNLPALDVLYEDIHGNGGSDAAILYAPELQPMQFQQGFSLRNIKYSYPMAAEPTLQDINLTIERNSSVGFVGSTGSGKTTTADIILGLLHPSSGQLLVDGVVLDKKNIRSWQRNIGYVPQQIFIGDFSLAQNIALGVPEGEINREAVTRAAGLAKLDKFVDGLPNGFDTVMGDRGIRMSGGQRQRIGIARALYRDPEVLIMDEATSALDGITEEAVMDALQLLSGKKTLILIAHRFTTLKNCDVIYQMEHGRVVSQGNYDELMESSPWFRAAARASIK
jgi:ABC-type bacteriocin/lantibiotic exporter with double-glycine peptidase domain